MNKLDVEVGQVWEDTDPRQQGRTVEVMGFGVNSQNEKVAIVRLNTVARNVSRNAIGRRTRIRLDRFDGKEYRPSLIEPHRFGQHKSRVNGGDRLGYYPLSQLAATPDAER